MHFQLIFIPVKKSLFLSSKIILFLLKPLPNQSDLLTKQRNSLILLIIIFNGRPEQYHQLPGQEHRPFAAALGHRLRQHPAAAGIAAVAVAGVHIAAAVAAVVAVDIGVAAAAVAEHPDVVAVAAVDIAPAAAVVVAVAGARIAVAVGIAPVVVAVVVVAAASADRLPGTAGIAGWCSPAFVVACRPLPLEIPTPKCASDVCPSRHGECQNRSFANFWELFQFAMHGYFRKVKITNNLARQNKTKTKKKSKQ